MRFIFREDKATEVASRFLVGEAAPMNVVKLVKLIYLADRESLRRFGRPITFDTFFSMKNGPVASSSMDCINESWPDAAPVWSKFIGQREGNTISLRKRADIQALSPVEMDVLEHVWGEFGALDEWTLVEYTHLLPEWHDPNPEKRRPIKYTDILGALGWSKVDIDEAIADLKAEVHAQHLFR